MYQVTIEDTTREELDEMLAYYRECDPTGKGMQEIDLLREIIEEEYNRIRSVRGDAEEEESDEG